jgi:inner membrane protein involved in colicin E2 resistance
MKKIALITIITTILVVIPIMLILATIIEEKTKAAEQEKTTTENVCEHDWVITSEYSWIRGQYRTISKCSKCGTKMK